MSNDIRNEIKSYIAKSGMTLTEIVAEYNKTHEPTTTQNISNKLSRGTIKYSECLALAEIMGYDITWIKRGYHLSFSFHTNNLKCHLTVTNLLSAK